MEKFKIGPHKIVLEYNYRAIRTYEKETGESYLSVMRDLGETEPKLTSIIGLVYAGIIGADPEAPYTIDQVAEWTMQMGTEELSRVFQHFVQSFPQVKQQKAEKEPTDGTPGK